MPRPRPNGVVLGTLLGGHLAFVIVSAMLFARIVLRPYPKPINYDTRPVRTGLAIVSAVGWLLVFLGGYFFIGRASFFGPALGAYFAAAFCWWWKFGRAPAAPG